jgi:dipeptidyl aminopeptidase/acylaminoacyl peptidase
MKRITWCALLIAALVMPIVSRAQAPKAPIPQATVRELATIDGMVNAYAVLLPSGRALLYTPFVDGATMNFPRAGDSAFAYDLATRSRSLLGTNMLVESISPQGDRLAFGRTVEDGTGNFLWTMPIDPQTGRPTGEPQRVSLRPKNGVSAKFSPDGKLLAFTAGPRSDGTWDLTIVPATGGPERVMANYARSGSQTWSADGKYLYVSNSTNAVGSSGDIDRVPVAGGRSEVLFPRTAIGDRNRVGLSPDGRVAIFQDNPDRFFYRTATGLEGEISVPLPKPIDWGSGQDMTLASMRYTLMTHVLDRRVGVLDVATGQSRDVLPANESGSAPAWSPDGRRLAVLLGDRSHWNIAVMNADGSGLRRYPIPVHLAGWGGAMPWSPDGRLLFFQATDRPEIGSYPDDTGQLGVLNVASGETRILASISSGIFGGFAWRLDGKAIRARRSPLTPKGGLSSHSYVGSSWLTNIVEIDLDGAERLLRDISPEFREPTRIGYSGDRDVVLAVKSGADTDRFLVPLDGGAARRLERLPEPSGNRLPAALGWPIARNRLLVQSRPEVPVVSILSTAGGSTSVVRLPAGTLNWRPHSDGEHILATVGAAGQAAHKIVLVPLDGTAPRSIGELLRITGPGGTFPTPLTPSPDGKLIAYTAGGVSTTKIFEVDFTPALQAIATR